MKRCCRGDQCVHPDGPMLPKSEFYPHKGKYLQSECKLCARIRKRERRRERYATDSEYRQRCIERDREYKTRVGNQLRREYRQANREEYNRKHRERIHWRMQNEEGFRERELLRRREYNQRNRDRLARLKQERWRSDPEYREKSRERVRRWCKRPEVKEQIKERRKGYGREYYQRRRNDPQYLAQKNTFTRARRALKRGAPGSHTADDVLRLREAQRDRCFYCGTDVSGCPTVDHVLPLSRGGSNNLENLVIACFSCNATKQDRTPEEWGWYASCPLER